MRWEDEGLLINVRKYGETSALIELLTKSYGKRVGLLRGAFKKNLRPIIQPGNQLHVNWNSRLEYSLGEFKAELIKSRFHTITKYKSKIQFLNLICTLCSNYLPERDIVNSLYVETTNLLDSEKDFRVNLLNYIKWEMVFLKDLGFGLDLRRCVVTGSLNNLSFVSPKSGCAVSRHAALGWEKRLLLLPKFLLEKKVEVEKISVKEYAEGLSMTGYFLRKWLSPIKSYNSDTLFATRTQLLNYLKTKY